MNSSKKLIDRDIEKKFQHEEKIARDHDENQSPYKLFEITVAIFMAAIVMSGILYAVLSVFWGK